jgi:hypothetical protein
MNQSAVEAYARRNYCMDEIFGESKRGNNW